MIPSLLLQTTRKTSKSKDHIKVLQQRLDSWKSRDIEELIFEAAIMQSYLNYINKPKEIAELSIGFITMMQKGNVNGSSSC